MSLSRPCLECGTPVRNASRCPEHQRHDNRPKDRTERGYGTAWMKLSRRARRLQQHCSDCGATEDLTADHSEEAWRRHYAGKPIRLQDVDVVCRSCNSRRGARRGRPAEGKSSPDRQGTGSISLRGTIL